MFHFLISNQNPNTHLQITEQWEEVGIHYALLQLVCEEPTVPQTFSMSFSLPVGDMHSIWSPQTDANGMRKLGPNWNKKVTQSRFAHGLPLHGVLAANGHNRMTVALSDVKTPLSLATGISEERAELECKLTFFTQLTVPIREYRAVVRIDLRDIPFYECIPDAVTWWETRWGLQPDPAPEAAKEPVNSLWYSLHQQQFSHDILRQCRLSAPYGLKTVILDDGWQTEDNNRGYAYCGDWELATAKIPDMRALVDEIHSLGQRVMLWYSMPYVGIHSKSFALFDGKYLSFDARRGVACLDPRYACVRQYLVDQYENAVRGWDLDGLKLDFVNAFRLTPETPIQDPAWDIPSLEEAIEQLLTDVKVRLARLKPDILLEFRQGYIGPAMRRFGNMLRVGDCPRDALCNKTAILDLRLTSGSTPVHSDMLMWHPDEPVESAALQLASMLFSVPQISMRLDELPEAHKQMLGFYLDFWRANRRLLLEGKLTLWAPEAFYSKARASLDGRDLTVLYTDSVVIRDADRATVVNCGPERTVYLDGFAGQTYRVVNCMGQETAHGVLDSLSTVTLPGAGILLTE